MESVTCPACGHRFAIAKPTDIRCDCGKTIRASVGSRPVNGLKNKPGTALATLIPAWAVEQKTGCGCRDFQQKMDGWGTVGCREQFDVIVEHLVCQKRHLKGVAALSPDWMCRAAATKLLTKAIEKSE